MMAYIINIGDEVLYGKVLNGNGAFLGYELERLGIAIEKIVVIKDDVNTVVDEIKAFLISDSKILITTGGLGVTNDDITKKAISLALQKSLEKNEEIFKMFYNKKVISTNALMLSLFPKTAQIINNEWGIASGFVIKHNNKIIISLVGPPFEMEPMFNKAIKYLPVAPLASSIKEYTLMGKSEAEFEKELLNLKKEYQSISINPYCSIGKIRYIIKGNLARNNLFEKCINNFKEIMSHYIIGEGNILIEEEVYRLLQAKNYTISFGESCTGGLLAAKMINVPGASCVINESIISYSNNAKTKYFNVSQSTIEKYGVVSSNVVDEMVQGLFLLTKSEVCVAVSGIAGPEGGSANKPVGLVYYAIKIKEAIYIENKLFSGNRNLIRERAAMWIFYRIWYYLQE